MAGKRRFVKALDEYFEDSRKPIYSLVLMAPFLAFYELGLLIMHSSGEPQYRVVNGADDLIRRVLSVFGVHGTFVSVAAVALCFIIWEYRRRGGLRMEGDFVGWLYAECLLYALFLLVAGGQMLSNGQARGSLFAQIVLSCGAGVYEELVFRLVLVGLLTLAFRNLVHLDEPRAGIAAVVFGALIFSAFHYRGLLGTGMGDPFEPASALFWRTFIFRAAAGAFFSALYCFRSFGVAVGTHALYDILVAVTAALAR